MTRKLGPKIDAWKPALLPAGVSLTGIHCGLRPLELPRDLASLWEGFRGLPEAWDYLGHPPPDGPEALQAQLAPLVDSQTPCFVVHAKERDAALGYACFWTVEPEMGSIEIGNVNLGRALRRSRLATEAFYLMCRWAFESGYRRVEWKCDALNRPSRRAAQRLGFSYEGLFRQHRVVKGRNRDTAWFAMTDQDWVALSAAFQTWLRPENFDAAGRQRSRLADLTAPLLIVRDPEA